MEWHPYAACFPLMTADRLESLSRDIAEKGLVFPIIIDADDRIIDGRNRFRACEMAGVKPVFEPFIGTDDDIRSFVVSTNMQRRDLTEPERVIAAAKIANIEHGSNRHTTKLDPPNGGSTISEPVSVKQAAEMLNVKPRQVERGKVIVTKGVPELADAVSRGDIEVAPAEVIARLPKEEQPAAIERAKDKPVKSQCNVKTEELSIELSSRQEQSWLVMSEDIFARIRNYVRRTPASRAKVIKDLKDLVKSIDQ